MGPSSSNAGRTNPDKSFLYRSLAVMSVLLASLIGLTAAVALFKPFDGIERSIIRLEPGEGAIALASKVSAHRTAQWLSWPDRLVIRAMAARAPLQAGEYEVSAHKDLWSLIEAIQNGKRFKRTVTLVEGWTLMDWQRALESAPGLGLSNKELTPVFSNSSENDPGTLGEGWFMPDTYQYEWGTAADSVYVRANQAMVSELQRWIGTVNAEGAFSDGDRRVINHFETRDWLTLASMVEKESSRFDDQRKIARVFLNRLALDMRLQSDPTVIYALGNEFDGDLTRRDLKVDAPHNTYRYKGLPPGPICNPGRQAIEAVFRPVDGDWLYFVGRGDGTSQFSKTLREHNRAVRKYQLGIETDEDRG